MAGAPNPLALIAILGWAPVVIVLFVLLPARRAVVVGSVTAWLFLPPMGLDLPGMPGYTKVTATTAGILLATLILEFGRLLNFRIRWFDVPMIIWSLCPALSSLSNDLGPYDALSQAFKQTSDWFFPYLVGRLYLTDAESLREFALGIIVGGVCLIPFVLFEIRMSPRLLSMVYGFGTWEGTRYGGYRPRVFFSTAIEFGLWMNCVTLLAWWHWRTGQLKRLLGFSGGAVFGAILITTIACRATSAMALNLLGFGALWYSWRTKTKRLMWVLLLIGPLYYTVRMTNVWSGAHAVELSRVLVNAERAQSLEYRLEMEDLYIVKVKQRLLLGWGGWGRNNVYDSQLNYRCVTVLDGRWVGALGNFGLLGLASMTAALLLPTMLLVKRYPVTQWDQPSVVSATGFALILNVYVLDGLINGMLNLLYVIAAGGLVNVVTARSSQRIKIAADPKASTLAQYRDMGRVFKGQARFADAKSAWLRALDVVTNKSVRGIGLAALEQPWCDCANDLAWLLITSPDPAVRDPVLALSLASKATEAHPECSTFWNTLGAVQYRVGDYKAAITALDHAATLAGGGSAFDHFFLAMAHAQLGNQEQAQQHFDEAKLWAEQHAPGHTELNHLRAEASAIACSAAVSIDAPR
jgi:tetratricopeptide (TPR) repeat protein